MFIENISPFLFTLYVFAFVSFPVSAQKVATFQHTYAIPTGKANSNASSVLSLPDKGFLISGVYEYEYDPYEILIIRTDSLGRQIWAKTYSGGNNSSGVVPAVYLDWAADMILTPEGNVVICSNTLNATAVYLFKINLNGGVLWSKTYPGGNGVASTLGMSIMNDPLGGYVMTGTSNLVSTHGETLVMKTDTEGNIIWANVYNHPGYQGCGLKIIPARVGGYYVAGLSNDTTQAGQFPYPGNYLVMKIDKNGKLLWSKVYSDSALAFTKYETANSILELPDKSIYLSGIGKGVGSYGAALVKLDSVGDVLWSKIYYGPATTNIELRSAVYDNLKKAITISTEFESSIGLERCGMMRLDTSGNIIFSKTFGDSALSEYGYRGVGDNLLQLQSGNFVLLQSAVTNYNWGYFFVKTDSGGNSNNCNTSLFSISAHPYPLNYLYSYTATSISPKVGSGCTVASIAVKDSVFCPPFVANFGWIHTCAPSRILFYDSSYYKAINWKWDFGDPSSAAADTSTAQNPFHIYTRPGKYMVKLRAGNGTESDSFTRTITILPSAIPFRYDTLICAGGSAKITVSGAAKYTWRPGNLVSDSELATQVISPKKTVTFVIVATGADGCPILDTAHVSVDNKPSPPGIDYATVKNNNEIDVKFQRSDSNDVKDYMLFRSINGGAYQKIATINSTAIIDSVYLFRDTSVAANKNRYSYKILAGDSCGAMSDTSVVHQSMLLNVKQLGCIQTFQLKWNAYQGWSRVPGIKKYEVHRSADNGSDSLIATLPGNAPASYKDTGLDYRKTYCYTILAFDGSDSFVSRSNTVCAQTFYIDTPQIVSVSKISTSKTNGTVIVKWEANKRSLAYSKLYFSRDGSHFGLLNGHLLPDIDSFIQTGLDTKDSDYEYYVITMDSCGIQSAKSPISKTMTLTVTVGQLLHKLNWTPYLGFKIKEYKIERLVGTSFVAIDSVPGTDTFSRIFPAPCNYAIRYRIVAIGYDSGETSWSDTMGRQAIDTIPVDAPVIQTIKVLNANSAKINFTGSDSLSTYEFAIQRSVNGVWGTAGAILFNKPGDSLSFVDTVNAIKNSICYTVIALDSCLNVSASDTVCLVGLSGNGLYCNAKAQLSWPAFNTPPALPDSLVLYRSTDGINYSETASLPAKSTGYADITISTGKTYYYSMVAVYNKSNITSYSDTVQVTPRIIPHADSAQLIYATVIKSDETRGAILVQWKRANPTDTNARGYYVYSYNPTNGKYALLKDVTDLNDTSYIQDNINTLQNIYKYYIITYNVCDVGINSNIHKTVLLKVQSNNLNEQLNWTNYLGVPVRSYSVYKSEDGGPQNLLANAGIDSILSDSDIVCNHNFTYQIQAILANGEISFSDSITVRSFDTIKPRTGAVILATVTKTGVSSGKVLLSWNAATDKNLEGYNIHRSSDGLYWSLIIDHWPGTSLIDTGLDTYNQPYYYKIQPVDSCGNVGTYTIYHETIHLKASANNGYNQLYWNGYAGWQVKQYLVYKNGILVTTLANNVFAFKDTAVICQNVYQYLIKAIDSVNDTIVSSSNTDSARAQSHNPPKAVYIKTVSVSSPNKAVTISWSPSTSYDVKDYVIYRKSALDGSMKFVDSSTGDSYIDSNQISVPPLGVGGNGIGGDCYYVFARDHCGNLSNGSNEGCIIILNAKSQAGSNRLTWNSYQNWPDGIQSYNVYKQEDSTGWQMIGTVSSPLNGRGAFEDNNLGDSTISFCYQVEAVENQGQYNQLSRSTVECVHQDATVFIPNSFTPYNADGVNDFFGPKGVYIKDYDMKIYNRWGELVYSSPSPSGEGRGEAGWDGTYKGQPVQQGIYIYLITVEDYNGKKSYFKGTITMFE